MKKLFTSLIMLMALFTASWAQYLTVGGVTVNLSATSVQTITGSNISGSVTYDPSRKTLYLNNATINGSISGTKFGTSSSDRHFIHLTGSNAIKSSYHGMRFDDSYVVLYGKEGATLNINTSESSADFSGIDTEKGHFEVWAIRLIMNGKTCGFWGNPSSGTLSFVNSMVSINCEGGAIVNCKSVSYDDCKCITSDATHKSSTGYVNSSGTLLTSLEIWPLLTVGNEPVRTVGDSKTGTLYSWKWTKSTKTLEITGNISTGSYYGIKNYGVDGLTVKTDGAYKISSNWYGLYTDQNTTFSGSGSLTLEGKNTSNITDAGIYVVGNKTITVAMKELLAQGGKYGIYNPNGTLTLNKLNNASTYKFLGETANVYTRYLNLNDMDIWTTNSYFNTSDYKAYYKGEVANKANTSDGTWFASKNQITYYPITVGGTQVNNRNKDNIYSPFITSGKVSYDLSTKTLTLDNVAMNCTEDKTYGIWTGSDAGTITIKLVGTNAITTNYTSIGINNNVVFTGSGNMRLKSNNDYGISCMGSCTKLSFETSNYFLVDSKSFAIYGTRNEVVMNKANNTYGYRFTNTSGGAAIYNIGKLTLDDMDFFASDNDASYSAGCYFDESKYAVVQNGGATAKSIAFHSIQEALPIYVCGKQLNKVYNNDIIEVGSPYITAGGAKAVCYDPSTKTLTLNGATINYQGTVGNNAGIKVDNVSVTINVKGNNSITGNDKMFSPLWLQGSGADVTLTGDGKLSLSGTYRNCNAVYLAGSTLRVGGSVTLEANGNERGIGNNNISNGTLIVGENAIVKASSISTVKTLTLNDGQTIVEPRGAQFKDNGVYVGSTLAQNVVIQKAESYGHTMGDITINSYNASDVLGDGTVSYDHSTKTLTLKNTKFEYAGKEPLISANGDLDINVVGENVLTSTTYTSGIGLRCQSNSGGKINIIGDGSLKVSAKWMSVYLCSRMDLTIKDNVKVEIVGKIGDNNVLISQKLTVAGNATLKAGQISNLKELVLEDGQTIVEPAGAEFKDGGVYVGNTLAQNVVIQKVEKYGVLVYGEEVTNLNCADILGDGKLSFNPSTKTLTLNNAKMTVGKDDEFNCISNYKGLKGLIIDVNGTCELNSASDWSSLNLRMDATITGSGTLKLTGSGGDLYADDGANITINNVNIEAEGCFNGANKSASLAIYLTNGKKVSVESGVFSWKDITLGEGVAVTQPAGATISNGTIVTSTGGTASNVVIELDTTVKYDLWIAGTQVTSANADDILGNGVFSYDPGMKTLTIKGNYEYAETAGQVVNSEIDGLTIKIASSSKITSASESSIIYLAYNTEITGGKLVLACTHSDADNMAIYQEFGNKLTFSDAYVEIGDGFSYAITGEPDVALEINNSDIIAKAHKNGCFKDFGSMTLSGCYIDSPRNTVYENEALRDADGNIIGGGEEYETVIIRSGADAIDGIDATNGPSEIYDVAGRKLDNMGRGINIVRTSDGKTRKVLKK